MTVEQYMRHFLEQMEAEARDAVDEAIDAVSLRYKQQREELQEYRHQRRCEQVARHKAGVSAAALATPWGSPHLLGLQAALLSRIWI